MGYQKARLNVIVLVVSSGILWLVLENFYRGKEELLEKQIEVCKDEKEAQSKDFERQLDICQVESEVYKGLTEKQFQLYGIKEKEEIVNELLNARNEIDSLIQLLERLVVKVRKDNKDILALREKLQNLKLRYDVMNKIISEQFKTINISFIDWKFEGDKSRRKVEFNDNDVKISANLADQKYWCRVFIENQFLTNLPDNYDVIIESQYLRGDNQSDYGIVIQDYARGRRLHFNYNQKGSTSWKYAVKSNFLSTEILSRKIQPGRVNIFMIRKRGNRFSYYMNNKIVCSNKSASFNWKRLELFVRGKQTVEFRNARIIRYD